MNNIGVLGRYCQDRGCYSTAANEISAIFHMQTFASIIRRIAEPINSGEASIAEYNDFSGAYSIVCIQFQIKALYSGNSYLIKAKLIFPPNFPRVAPIFSIINTNSNRFVPGAFYARFPLPDESYAVELRAAAEWPTTLRAETLFEEFTKTINSEFPLFRAMQIPTPRFPTLFDERYNAIRQSANSATAVLSAETNAVKRLREFRRKVDERATATSAAFALSAESEAITAKCASLSEFGENICEENFEKLICFDDQNEKLVLQLRAQKFASEETVAFFETFFFENETVKFENAIKALEIAWKSEFDAMIWISELEENVN